MILQSEYTGLTTKLQYAGLKVDAARGDNYRNPGSPLRSVRATDDNLPVLDEALALAEDLTRRVRG